MTVDIDTEIVTNALKRAGLMLYKTNGKGTLDPFKDLAVAIKAEIALAYESERAKRLRGFEQWTPDEISGIRARAMVDGITGVRDPRLAITPKDKGPRPYSVSTREMLDDYVRKIYGPLARKAMLDAVMHGRTRFMGMDFGFDERSETGNEHEAPKKPEPCPHASMDDDGGPPVEKENWDTSPKVGYGVDDHKGREAQRKSDAARIAAVMGWKD